jgi:hypothetical protein
MKKKAIAVAVIALSVSTVALVPGSAHAGGPTTVCVNDEGINNASVAAGASVQAIFASDGVEFLTGSFVQNGNKGYGTGTWFTFRMQSSNSNQIVIGATNYQAGPWPAYGWMTETWAC